MVMSEETAGYPGKKEAIPKDSRIAANVYPVLSVMSLV
jgi:hypothetical protein